MIWAALFGYVLALIAAALFAVECRLRQRDRWRHGRELKKRDKRIEMLVGRCGFLDRQNRALFAGQPRSATRPRCATATRTRARTR